MARTLQYPQRNLVCLAPLTIWPGVARADNLADAPPAPMLEWTPGDTLILIALILFAILLSLAVYASLLHLKKDIATTDSILKKIILIPIFLGLLLVALCLLPLMALYWWFHPLILKTPASRRGGKDSPSS